MGYQRAVRIAYFDRPVAVNFDIVVLRRARFALWLLVLRQRLSRKQEQQCKERTFHGSPELDSISPIHIQLLFRLAYRSEWPEVKQPSAGRMPYLTAREKS